VVARVRSFGGAVGGLVKEIAAAISPDTPSVQEAVRRYLESDSAHGSEPWTITEHGVRFAGRPPVFIDWAKVSASWDILVAARQNGVTGEGLSLPLPEGRRLRIALVRLLDAACGSTVAEPGGGERQN
jgi:hypothetical protein